MRYTLRMMLRLALIALLLLASGTAVAQSIRIGVVLDRIGASGGPAMAAAVSYFDSRTQRTGGVFGAPFEVIVRDGRGEPTQTRAEVERLILEDEVHAIVCCTRSASTELVHELAELHDVLVLALSPGPDADAGWLYGLGADQRTELRAIVSHSYGEGKSALALMTLDNAFGDLPERVLGEELEVAGMRLVAVERYSPAAEVLTPEALWVATRQPGAVVVWGLLRDTTVAVDALRRRGYEGPIYARADLAGELGLQTVQFPVPPILVADARSVTAVEASAAAALSDAMSGIYGVADVTPEAARAFDALDLLRAAAEQAALYGVSPDATASYRLALRDAAIALPEFEGAAGRYDLDERTNQAALPGGLVIAEPVTGRLVPVGP